MAVEFYYKQGGVHRKVKEFYYKQGGVHRKLKELWYKVAGTWRLVYSGFTAGISNILVDNTGIAGSLNVVFNTDASLDYTQEGATLTAAWGNPVTAGIGASYWLRGTLGTGTGVMSGTTLGVWNQLNSARSFTMAAAPNGSVRQRNIFYELSTSSGGSPVVASRTITFTSDRS